MREALNRSCPPITLSMCEWATAKPWLWAKGIGNLWRTTGDIDDKWEGEFDYKLGMMTIVDLNEPLYPFSGPEHWNDPDMLEVGNGGLTTEEYRTHFSLWSMMAAPLIAGNDIMHLSSETRSTLLNRDVIAVDQDSLGQAGRRLHKDGDLEVWTRALTGGIRAVLLFNRGKGPADIGVKWSDLGYPDAMHAHVQDPWQGKDLGDLKTGYTAHAIPSHSVIMLLVQPVL